MYIKHKKHILIGILILLIVGIVLISGCFEEKPKVSENSTKNNTCSDEEGICKLPINVSNSMYSNVS